MSHNSFPFDSNTAGRRMATRVPVISTKSTILEAKKLITEHTREFDTISYIYVVTKHKHLAGVLSIRNVFSHPPDTLVRDVMEKEIVKVHPKTDQEKAAHLAIKHGIKAVPVVSEDETFLGTITPDTMLDIIDQEFEEDLLKSTGIVLGKEHTKELHELTVFSSLVRRLPWILLGLLGGIGTAGVINQFQGILTKNIILASFIPLIAYIANAVGTQTQTIFIRDLARRQFFSPASYMLKQILVSTLISISCAAAVLFLAVILWGSIYLGFVVGFAMFFAIIVATFFSLSIPFILLRFKIDPAVGSGPFSTVIQDLFSVLIYFQIASYLL